MQQAVQNCETSHLELKGLPSFLAINFFQRTKNQKVINLEQSSSKKLVHICTRMPYCSDTYEQLQAIGRQGCCLGSSPGYSIFPEAAEAEVSRDTGN
jgi:hypothetical protein